MSSSVSFFNVIKICCRKISFPWSGLLLVLCYCERDWWVLFLSACWPLVHRKVPDSYAGFILWLLARGVYHLWAFSFMASLGSFSFFCVQSYYQQMKYFWLFFLFLFLFFPFLIVLAMTSRETLNGSEQGGQPCLVPDLRGMLWGLVPLEKHVMKCIDAWILSHPVPLKWDQFDNDE